MTTGYETREEWLNAAVASLDADLFMNADAVPLDAFEKPYRISCGFGPGSRGGKKILGTAYQPSVSNDHTAEIFISPLVDNPLQVLAIVAHERTHTLSIAKGHRGDFAKIARQIGFNAPFTTFHDNALSPELIQCFEETVLLLGDYPHAKMDLSERKRQPTRLVKVTCTECKFHFRTSAKQIAQISFPAICPACLNEGLADPSI